MRKSSKLSIYQKLKKLANSNDLDLFFEGCKSKTDDFQFETEKMMIYFDQQVVDLYQEIEKKGSSDLLKVVYVLAKLSKPVAKRTLDPGMATSFFEYPSEMFELNSNSSTFVNDELERKDLHLFSICDGFGAFKNIAGEHLSLPKLLKETTLIPSRVKKSLAKAQVESVVKGTKDAVDRHEHKSNYRAALDLYLKRSLLAWDAQTVPQYQTETNYYRGIYEKFILHPYLTRQDLNLVPQADLIDKLFNALLGIESDLFTFSKPDMFKLDFIRLETVGSKALMQFLSKFLKSARVLKNLQDYSEKVAFRSLTGESLSSSLELIIRIIHINVINLQANHQRTPTTLLQLYIILEPIQTLCKELESDFLTNPQSNLSILLSQLYTRIISLQPENPYTPYIVWIFQKSTQPLFKFISGWIGNCPIDPFNEFFIVDNQYLPDRVPNFIPSSLSKRIFELHNIDNSLQLHTEFCPEWIIEDNERNEYLFKFEQMVAFNRDMYRDNYFKAQLEHWNELQADLDRRVAERGHQQVRLQQANANLDYQREVVNNRKKELKKSVEAFLEERKEFKAKMEEFNRLEDQRELSALEQKNLERERLMDIERNEIVSRFEAALKLLEKKEMVVDWRQKRIELNPQRNTKLAEPWDSNELCIPEFVLPVFEEVDATTQPQEEHESFYSAEINISKESICNLDDNSNETNAAEEVMIMPNNLPIVKDIEVRDNASQVFNLLN